MKTLLISASAAVAFSCGHVGGNVKVYDLQASRGLVRKQANEVIPFANAVGYLCASKSDTREIITCTGGSVKIYQLRATHLVRKQANEVKSFTDANGYQCVSPASMSELLSKCR